MSDAEVAYPTADSVCSRKGCERPAWRSCPEGKCLYHSPSNGDSAETARLVWNNARQMAADKDAEGYDFVGWHFPNDPDERYEGGRPLTGFAGFHFEKPVSFRGATFNGIAWFGSATFNQDAWFNRATFGGNARFEGVTFGGFASFDGATFSGYARFDGARFHPGANIIFGKPRRGRPFRDRCEGETAYRLAKQTAQARGDYAAAGDYHYAEQCAIEDRYRRTFGRDMKGRPWRKAFRGWCIFLGRFLFGRLIYGYGERPMRPLFAALVVIFLWAGFYWLGGAIVPSDSGLEPAARAAYEPDFLECAYCSIVTFTTLGYGDYQPKEPYRLLAASEALLGAALMAVFIVCLSKKYIR